MAIESFAGILASAVASCGTDSFAPTGSTCRTGTGSLCRLCYASRISYATECKAKRAALQEFWSKTTAAPPLDPLVPSDTGRGYRTISKRKIFQDGRSWQLGLIDPDRDQESGSVPVERCAIEPAWHADVYRQVRTLLAHPRAGALLGVLRYVVVKGNEREGVVLLTVREIGGELVKAANTFSKHLTGSGLPVQGVLLYEDDSSGRYYLGNTGMPGKLMRLYGPKTLSHRTAGRRFVYGPLAFSQVNHAMLDAMVEQVSRLLGLPSPGTLYDLYCGYGLFGLSLADRVRRVVGADSSPDAIDAAQENSRHFGLSTARFVRNALTAETVHAIMRQSRPDALALLDPPRGGTAEGVIETIAAHRPHRVVHLFCNIDLMPGELERWRNAGYALMRAVPMDMFPGTATMEILTSLAPAGE